MIYFIDFRATFETFRVKMNEFTDINYTVLLLHEKQQKVPKVHQVHEVSTSHWLDVLLEGFLEEKKVSVMGVGAAASLG